MENKLDIYTLLKIISDPTRLRILALLDTNELAVNQIENALDLSQANTSKHLKKLLDSGIINKNKVSQTCYYSMNFEYLRCCEIYRPVMTTFKKHPDAIKDLKNLSEVL